MPNQRDQAWKIRSDSHSWFIHGWPKRVNDQGSLNFSEPVSQIQRPDARCHHRSEPITVVKPKDQKVRTAASSQSRNTDSGSDVGAMTVGADT